MIRKLTDSDLKLIRLVEGKSGAVVRDCVVSDSGVVFVVESGMEKLIGPGGRNVRQLQHSLKKNVRFIQWSDALEQFVRNVFVPNEISSISNKEGVIVISAPDYSSRGMLIGRNACILRANETIVKRFFDISEIRVE